MRLQYGATPEEIKANTEAMLTMFKNGAKQYIRVIFKDANDNNITFTDDDVVSEGVQLTTVINPDTNLKFGCVPSTEFICYILKNANSDLIDWSKKIELKIGYIDEYDLFKVLSMGTYYSKEHEVINENGIGIIKFTAYDEISKLDTVADDFIDSMSYPCSIWDLIDALAAYIGIPIIGTIASPVSGEQLHRNPFPYGCTFRNIISWIAEYFGGFAYESYGYQNSISWTTIERPWYHIEYKITPDDYYEMVMSNVEVQAPPAVAFVDTENPSNNVSYPSTYTGNPYYIVNNPIIRQLTTAEKTTALTFYKNYPLTFDDDPYIPMRVTAIGNPFVEVGDIIDVEDSAGNVYPLRIFSRIFKWNGSAVDYYECTGVNEWGYDAYDLDESEKSGKYKAIQEAVTDPIASGTAVEFISGITQDEQGVITPLKKTVRTASRENTGLCPAMPSGSGTSKFLREDGSWANPPQDRVKSLGTANNSTKTINFSGNVEFLLIVNSLSDNRNAMFICYGRSGNSCSATQVYCGSNITVTTDTGKIKVKNSASFDARIYALILSGDASDMS